MKITLVTVGKIKERYFEDAIREYAKRLSRYCKLDIIQVADEMKRRRTGPARPLSGRLRKRKDSASFLILKMGLTSLPWPLRGR